MELPTPMPPLPTHHGVAHPHVTTHHSPWSYPPPCHHFPLTMELPTPLQPLPTHHGVARPILPLARAVPQPLRVWGQVRDVADRGHHLLGVLLLTPDVVGHGGTSCVREHPPTLRRQDQALTPLQRDFTGNYMRNYSNA